MDVAKTSWTVAESFPVPFPLSAKELKKRREARDARRQQSNRFGALDSGKMDAEAIRADLDWYLSLLDSVKKPVTSSELEDFKDTDSEDFKDTDSEESDSRLTPYLHDMPRDDNCIGMQVFSVKVTEIQGVNLDENADVRIYGSITGRDSLDGFKRNSLFRRDFDKRIRLGCKGTVALFGPRRCLDGLATVEYEFNLYAVCNGEPKGKRLVEDIVGFYYPQAITGMNQLLGDTIKGPNGTIKILFAAFTHSFMATVEVKHSFGKRSGLCGKIGAFLMFDKNRDISKQEIVLFDSDLMNEEISFHRGAVKLWCPVLSVPKETGMRLEVHLKSPEVTGNVYCTRVAKFNADYSCKKELDFGFVRFTASLSWLPPPAC